MTVDVLAELFSYHTWATEALIEGCASLPGAVLDAEAPGTYGTVIATLRHLVGADERYLDVLEGVPFREDVMETVAALDLDALRELNRDHGARYQRVLEAGADASRPITRRRPDGREHTITARTLLVQAIHHGNEHRAHVCTVLGAHNIEIPGIDAWAFYQEALRPLRTTT